MKTIIEIFKSKPELLEEKEVKELIEQSIYYRTFAFAYVLLVAVIFCGCDKPKGDGFAIKVIDSCEYIEVDSGIGEYYRYTLTHKGNCKFCEERSKK